MNRILPACRTMRAAAQGAASLRRLPAGPVASHPDALDNHMRRAVTAGSERPSTCTQSLREVQHRTNRRVPIVVCSGPAS